MHLRKQIDNKPILESVQISFVNECWQFCQDNLTSPKEVVYAIQPDFRNLSWLSSSSHFHCSYASNPSAKLNKLVSSHWATQVSFIQSPQSYPTSLGRLPSAPPTGDSVLPPTPHSLRRSAEGRPRRWLFADCLTARHRLPAVGAADWWTASPQAPTGMSHPTDTCIILHNQQYWRSVLFKQ